MDSREIKDKAQDWQQAAEETAEDLQDKAQEWKRTAAEKMRNTGQAIDEYVHDNTWTTIATAAVLGCVIGFLIGRGRD
jgi:ElaB/YqjD/DUF883 family membrane-anchored ribosome-binding protein